MLVSKERYEQVIAHVWDGSNEDPRWECLGKNGEGNPTVGRLIDSSTGNIIAWFNLSGENSAYNISRIYMSV